MKKRQLSIATLQRPQTYPSEVMLALSIIREAQRDAVGKSEKRRQAALCFFASEGYEFWLDVVACFIPELRQYEDKGAAHRRPIDRARNEPIIRTLVLTRGEQLPAPQ